MGLGEEGDVIIFLGGVWYTLPVPIKQLRPTRFAKAAEISRPKHNGPALSANVQCHVLQITSPSLFRLFVFARPFA